MVIGLALMMTSGFITGTSASFNASASNRNSSYATASLTAPSALAASVSGNDVSLSWSAGSFGGGTGFGHRIQTRSMGVQADPRDGQSTPGTCAATDTFSTTAVRTNAATTTATHTGASSSANAGSWLCYRADTEYPANPSPAQWFSQTGNPVAAVMVGHVVRSVSAANGGTAGSVGQGDVFTFTFNQAVNIATGPSNTNNNPNNAPTTGNDVCVDPTGGVIVFGRGGTDLNTACSASNIGIVGTVSGLSFTSNGQPPAYHAVWSWSDCPAAGQCRSLSVTLGKRYLEKKDYAVTSVSASFTPSTTAGALTSAAGGVAICTAANTSTSTCRPVAAGSV
jgi:hypothetical protein